LAGQVPAGAAPRGGVHGDIEAGVADRSVGFGEAAAVAQLGPDGHRHQWPDAVVGVHQGAGGGMAPPEPSDSGGQRLQLGVGGIDHPVGECDAFVGLGSKLQVP
jgi:hypothetical protein